MQRLRVGLLVAGTVAVLAALVVVPTYDIGRWSAERDVVRALDGRVPGPVTVTSCEGRLFGSPNPYVCRVRDGAGRFGWVSVAVTSSGSRSSAPDRYAYTWGFPVAADGTVDDTVTFPGDLVASSPSVAGLAVSGELGRAERAFGSAARTTVVDCPAVVVGASVTCAGPAEYGPVAVTRTTAGSYRVRLRCPVLP